MYAKVVVDIRSDNLNETFDYLIPDELQEFVFIGSRVMVSFGFQSVLGYVVEINETSEFDGNLKPILEVLDYEKELTNEQVELARYLSEELNTPLVTTLGLMTPSFLKEKQRKYLYINDYDKLHPDLAILFNGKKKVQFDKELLKNNQLIKSEIKKQNISIGYDIYTYGSSKKNKVYYLTDVFPQKSEVRNKIVTYVSKNPNCTADDIMQATDCSKNIIQTLVKDKVLNKKEIVNLKRTEEPISYINKYHFNVDQEQLLGKYHEGGLKPYLLFSNDEEFKMHFYFNIIMDNIRNGKQTVFFTPTILLAEELNIYFRRFLKGVDILTFHSKNTNSENYDVYTNIRHNNFSILITTMGTFLPFTNVGLFVIIDEDNQNYIYDNYPYYDIRKVLIKRADVLGAKLIFDSATPAINTYYQTRLAKYYLLEYNIPPKSKVSIIDMREEVLESNNNIISSQLDSEIRAALSEKKISMLIVNNKAFSTLIKCRSCGEVLKCPQCKIPLSLVKNKDFAKCNLCGHKEEHYHICNKCGSDNIASYGFGLEQVNTVLSMKYPKANIMQVDSDNVKVLDDYTDVIEAIEEGTVDIIIGTNSLTNKLINDNIKVVAMLYVDSNLNLNDYRGAEYTYNLIAKMTNREVCIVQTYHKNHYAIVNAVINNYEGYYQQEINNRELLNYEPFTEMNRIVITGPYDKLFHFGYYYRKAIKRIIGEAGILGPSYDYRLQGVKLILKHNNYPAVIKVLNDAIKHFTKEIQVSFERDPKGM